MERATGGSGFDQLYDRHFPDVWHALRRLGVAERDLPDAVHDVFLVVHRRWAEFDPARPARPWLLAIAQKVAANQRRKASRREVPEDGAPVTVSHAAGAEELLGQQEKRALVSAALDQMDDEKRALLVLHDVEEVAIPDVAAMMEVPLNTAYSRLRLAREQFAKAIKTLTRQKGAA